MTCRFFSTDTSFNPRTHEGCDSVPFITGLPFDSFNPRTHEGCDLLCFCPLVDDFLFQSTHPRRVRLESLQIYLEVIKFQSTHPRRVRRKIVLCQSAKFLFQSTHPRRVRRCSISSNSPLHRFNPRTHEGCDKRAASLCLPR